MSLKSIGLGFAGLFAVLVAISSIWVLPVLNHIGFRRPVEDIGTISCIVEKCTFIESDTAGIQLIFNAIALQACEKMVLHKPSGLIYASCSTPQSRTLWQPALNRWTTPKPPSDSDFFAIVDTSKPLSSNSIKKVQLTGLPIDQPTWRGLNLVGLDVVESDTEKDVLWVYVINHRPPVSPADAASTGADSSVEIFRTTVGSNTFHHVKTVEDPDYLVTPNDVVGLPDGSGFWISNDHTVRVGIIRDISHVFGLEGVGITFCHINEGCKFAITGLPGINGISRVPKEMQKQGFDTFYAAEYAGGCRVFVMERQSDNSLVLADTVYIGYVMDNIHVEADGSIYVATFPRPLMMDMGGYMEDPINILNPASVHKVSVDPASFFGDKYQVQKVFENNGTVISGATTAVWDEVHGLLWIHGLASTGLAVCKL